MKLAEVPIRRLAEGQGPCFVVRFTGEHLCGLKLVPRNTILTGCAVDFSLSTTIAS